MLPEEYEGARTPKIVSDPAYCGPYRPLTLKSRRIKI